MGGRPSRKFVCPARRAGLSETTPPLAFACALLYDHFLSRITDIGMVSVLPQGALASEGGMAKTRTTRSPGGAKMVTAERAARLYRLLQLLGKGPLTREMLTRRLRLDVRGFYRDLEALRAAGIVVLLRDHHYTLRQEVQEAIARLPFPDPHLTLGDAMQLAKGRTAAHQKIKKQIAAIAR